MVSHPQRRLSLQYSQFRRCSLRVRVRYRRQHNKLLQTKTIVVGPIFASHSGASHAALVLLSPVLSSLPCNVTLPRVFRSFVYLMLYRVIPACVLY
ncbi:hypothetical protein P692DRAFT_20902805 [Suillus brevipes Sb2]|nr:hypothetical protein P692DRAFT_20902805 [Suillus brevipes Sb2]